MLKKLYHNTDSVDTAKYVVYAEEADEQPDDDSLPIAMDLFEDEERTVKANPLDCWHAMTTSGLHIYHYNDSSAPSISTHITVVNAGHLYAGSGDLANETFFVAEWTELEDGTRYAGTSDTINY